MIALDKLSELLMKLNEGTSPRRAKPVEFARFKDRAGKTVVRTKLQGIQNAALGSFDDADAQMLAALWDNRAQIIQRLQDDCRDLAKSLKGDMVDQSERDRRALAKLTPFAVEVARANGATIHPRVAAFKEIAKSLFRQDRFAETPAEAEALRKMGLGVGDPIPLCACGCREPTRAFQTAHRELAKAL